MVQSLNNDYVNRTNIQFGYDLDVNKQGSDILVGSPFEIDSKNRDKLNNWVTRAGNCGNKLACYYYGP